MPYKIMSHLVAGYPDYQTSLQAARAFVDGCTAYLEIQFPFSDGTADGPLIQAACSQSLDAGFKIKEGFRLIEDIRRFTQIPVFIMTYANIAYTNGIRNFLARGKAAGADGMIIPDLPPDTDEDLYATGADLGLKIIPVIAPSISGRRLALVLDKKTEYIYAALRMGITGKKTEIGRENIDFINRISGGNGKILGGFGISTREQVAVLSNYVHAAIVGTEFVRIISQAGAGANAVYNAILEKTKNLTHEE